MLSVYLTPTFSCEPRFHMFIINGYYTKKQTLVVLGLIVKRCNDILLCVL